MKCLFNIVSATDTEHIRCFPSANERRSIIARRKAEQYWFFSVFIRVRE